MGRDLIEIDEIFLERVYQKVAEIPEGRITTYGKIAELAGYIGAYREVGHAMSRVTDGKALPCHRVVNKSGELAPHHAFGGKERQRRMLMDEGITFLKDGAIDMDRHMWPEEERWEQMSLFNL